MKILKKVTATPDMWFLVVGLNNGGEFSVIVFGRWLLLLTESYLRDEFLSAGSWHIWIGNCCLFDVSSQFVVVSVEKNDTGCFLPYDEKLCDDYFCVHWSAGYDYRGFDVYLDLALF